MSQLARIKYSKDDHDQSNVVCEELKADLEITVQNIVTIWKVLQKEESGKGGSYTCLIWMVQLILEHLLNGTPPAAMSPNISSHN